MNEGEQIVIIKIRQSDFDAIVSHAQSCLPEEACGLIGGTKEADAHHIEKVYFLENIDHTNEHFSLNPKEQLRAVKDMRARGLVPLGNWHSHPETPSRPSAEDIRLSYDSTAHYLILSLMDAEHPVLNSFHVEGGAVTKEELQIISI